MGNENSELDMEFYLDSGAFDHMYKDIRLHGNCAKLKKWKQIKIDDGTLVTAIGTGTIYIQSYNGEKLIKVELQNVLHAPKLKINLFSQGKVLDKRLYMTQNSHCAKFIHQESKKICVVAKREDKLFKMIFRFDKNRKSTHQN